jgi:hypothetical protein
MALSKALLTAPKNSDIYFLDCREKTLLGLRQANLLAGGRAGGSHGRPAVTWEDFMKSVLTLMAGAAIIVSLHTAAMAKDLVVGVSWSNFQEERWKTDEAAIKAALEASGDKYISADAQASAAKQLTDIESLIAQGANAIIVLAQDSEAIGPAIEKAAAEGIPVVGYDRLIENRLRTTSPSTTRKSAACRPRSVQGQAGRQLRLHQGRFDRSRTLTSCSPDRWKC